MTSSASTEGQHRWSGSSRRLQRRLRQRQLLPRGHLMARMRVVDAAVAIMEREGVTQCFGLPGAAINPFYDAMRAHGGFRHTLARHVEGASHMAEGYTRTRAGTIGVCVGPA